MSSNSQIKQRIKWIGLLLLIVIITAIGIKFYLGYQELKQMDHKIANLKQDIEQLKKRKEQLQAEIDRVNSQQFIEDTAREKLGLVEQGEILYITVEKEKTAENKK